MLLFNHLYFYLICTWKIRKQEKLYFLFFGLEVQCIVSGHDVVMLLKDNVLFLRCVSFCLDYTLLLKSVDVSGISNCF